MGQELLNSIIAAKVHKEIIQDLNENKIIKPGNSINYIVDYIEKSVLEKIRFDKKNPLLGGLAFPVNISINDIVAHYTSSSKNNNYIINNNDIVKVDFGVHKNGTIIDSAQTFHFNKKYDDFINISKKCTNYAVSLCGPDVNLGDMGKDIEEYIKSKEIEIDNKVYPLFTLKELSGHNMDNYIIHKSKAVPNCKIDYPVRMESGEFFAIEPFVSTTSETYYDNPTNLFMIDKNYMINISILNKMELLLFNEIFKLYSTLCFCDKWLERDIEGYNVYIFNSLIKHKIIHDYKTIYVTKGNYVSQFEHNIYIKENGIIKITENDYY